MKICIIGGGAVGSQIVAAAAAAKSEVSLVARGPHLHAIQRYGLRIFGGDGEQVVKVEASDRPERFGQQDLVIVAVKTPSLPAVCDILSELMKPETPVVFVNNGIPWWYFEGYDGPPFDHRRLNWDPGEALHRSVSPHRVIGAVAYTAASIQGPGEIRVSSSRNRLIIGEPHNGLSERCQNIADLLTRGGLPSRVSKQIRKDIWSKLLLNLVSNIMAALGNSTVQDVFACPACEAAARRIIDEVQQIARHLGCELNPPVEKIIEDCKSLAHRPSTLQDIDQGRPVEVASLFDAPLQLARLARVSTPTLDLLIALLKLRARQPDGSSELSWT